MGTRIKSGHLGPAGDWNGPTIIHPRPGVLGPYFCQVRFLWRWARSFLRRLCLLILAFRRFLSDPIIDVRVNIPPCSTGTQ